MRRLIFLLTLLAGSFLVNLLQSTPALATNKQVVRVASIDWCPQLCPDREQGGYVYDLLALIFKDTEYTLIIETMPWSRAIRLTREGVTPILLAPARAEAPDLRYPNIPVGTQSMCFFTQASSSWTFQGALSLRGLNIGIANDTSIEELNDYVAANPGQFQFQPYSDQYIVSNLRKLERGRIDAFLFTKNTTRYEIDKIGWGG